MQNAVAIMQPTLLPWLGYFALIDRVDEFIFLDSVQFEKRSWQQRNRIKTYGGAKWITIPVSSKGKFSQPINSVLIDMESGRHSLKKIIRTLDLSYSQAPYYRLYREEFADTFLRDWELISDLNQYLIRLCCRWLGISTRFRSSTKLGSTGTKDELLFNICSELKASVYFSPPGSRSYLDDSRLFSKSSIDVRYHDYKHPLYNQLHGEFVSHLSIIDLLFNESPEQCLKLIRGGIG